MTSTLAELRAEGVLIRLKDDGHLGVQNASPAAMERLKAAKQEIIKALKREAVLGTPASVRMQFTRFRLDSIYQCIERIQRAGVCSEVCKTLNVLIWDLIETSWESLTALESKIEAVKTEAGSLASQVLSAIRGEELHGRALEKCVHEIFHEPKPKKVNRSAFASAN